MKKNKETLRTFKSLEEAVNEKFNGKGKIIISESEFGAINFVHSEDTERCVNIYPCKNCGIVEGAPFEFEGVEIKDYPSKECGHFCSICGDMLFVT